MPPAIAVVAIAAGAAAVAGASALAIAGVALAAGAIFSMMKQSQVAQDGYTAEPSGQTLRSSKAAARYIVGRISTGGVLQWAQEQEGSQANNEWLHLVYTLSEGAIAGVDEILLNDQPISSYGAHASYEVIINPTTPNAFLLANCPDWRDSMIGEGLSFVRVSLKYSNEKYPSGIPDAKFIVRGRTDIYDPRTGNTGYSDNCALIALWYLRTVLGVPDDELVMESFIDSANICAESVSNPDGSSSARYAMGAVIGDDERRGDVLKKIEAACGGKISRVGGRWMMRVGAYYGPADFTITEDMVIGAVQGSVEVDNDSAINTITGLFVDPESWAETDYPPVQSATWLAEDGEELSETLDLKYVTNPYQAQRLADIVLRMRRNGGGLKLPLNFSGYNCRPGRPVMVALPSLNMAGEFIVTDWSMVADSACSVTVEPYGPEVFDDQAGREYTPIGFIDIPVGGVAPPVGLTWTPDRQPEVRQGILSWTPPYGEISYYGVVIRDAANEAIQTYQVPGATSNCQVQGLPAGNYTMSVYASSANGRSAEATIGVAIMGPPQPQSISVQEGFDSITLIPFNLTGLNGGTYEYWYALTPTENPEAATLLGKGASFTHNGLAFNTVYHYYVRTVNAYGASAFFYRTATTNSDPKLILQIIAGQIGESELSQELLNEIEKISGDGAGSVNERLQELADNIGDIVDALAYDASKTYLSGDTVRQGQRLYQAAQNVPVNTPPPNAAYWLDIGSVVETANGLAAQVQQHTVAINDIDGKVTAQASTLEALQATYRDDNGEGELADALRGAEATAQFAQEVRTRASENQASVERDTLLQASVGETQATVAILEQAVATDLAAVVQTTQQLQATVGQNTAAIATTSQAQADLEGNVSALTTIKTQTTVGGHTVMAGLAIGVEGEEQESQILAFAQRFAIIDQATGQLITPFVVQGGQVFMNSAVISQADILNLIVTGELRSGDYIAGQRGIRINFVTNELEVNGVVAGQGRLQLTNQWLRLYHPNGVKGLELGIG